MGTNCWAKGTGDGMTLYSWPRVLVSSNQGPQRAVFRQGCTCPDTSGDQQKKMEPNRKSGRGMWPWLILRWMAQDTLQNAKGHSWSLWSRAQWRSWRLWESLRQNHWHHQPQKSYERPWGKLYHQLFRSRQDWRERLCKLPASSKPRVQSRRKRRERS